MKGITALLRRRRSIRRLGDAKGANLVEAAIVTPLLLLLTLGIVDFSAMFYAYLALEHGVSQATRLAITGQTLNDPSGTAMSRQNSIIQRMRETTPTLTLPDAAFAFSSMRPPAGTWNNGSLGGPGDIGRVTVTYTWTFMTPLIRPFFPSGQVVLRVSSTMKNEAVFN
jgi:Flp pilus assembly protein TadG